jgi:hypothetical protein
MALSEKYRILILVICIAGVLVGFTFFAGWINIIQRATGGGSDTGNWNLPQETRIVVEPRTPTEQQSDDTPEPTLTSSPEEPNPDEKLFDVNVDVQCTATTP